MKYTEAMIDYEFTIRRIEKELAHYREMQKFEQAHLDAHDTSIHALSTIMSRMEENQQEIQNDLRIITKNIKDLTEALLRQHKNGKDQ